jgi:hypothetical protein
MRGLPALEPFFYKEAYQGVINVADLVRNVCYLGQACFEKKTTRLAAPCGELQTYICNHQEAIVSYGQRQGCYSVAATPGWWTRTSKPTLTQSRKGA